MVSNFPYPDGKAVPFHLSLFNFNSSGKKLWCLYLSTLFNLLGCQANKIARSMLYTKCFYVTSEAKRLFSSLEAHRPGLWLSWLIWWIHILCTLKGNSHSPLQWCNIKTYCKKFHPSRLLNRDTIQISSADTLGHPWRSWEAMYGAIHTGLSSSLGFLFLPLPALPSQVSTESQPGETEQSREIQEEKELLIKILFLIPRCHLNGVWLNSYFAMVFVSFKIWYLVLSQEMLWQQWHFSVTIQEKHVRKTSEQRGLRAVSFSPSNLWIRKWF